MKYQYWTNAKRRRRSSSGWRRPRSIPAPGGRNWAEWLAEYSGRLDRAREPGSELGAIEDAPGSYVKAKH